MNDADNSNSVSSAYTGGQRWPGSVAENSPAMLWMGDQNGKCVFLNRAQREFWGVDPADLSAFDWSSTVHPDDVQKLAAPFTEAMATQTAFSVEARYRRADGQFRTLRTTAQPLFDAHKRFLGMTGVNTDVTEQLIAEELSRMLMGELNHRTKNILTVVQAVARQTTRSSPLEEFNATFESRLQGLAACNDLLLRNDWSGVDLSELVCSQLSHLGVDYGGRIESSGPTVRVPTAAAQTLGMALHELSTNSLKYGALNGASGRVSLEWATMPQGLRLSWVESGVGPVTPPSRKGFGHSVIVDMVSSALDAEVDMEFGADGFSWRVVTRSPSGLV